VKKAGGLFGLLLIVLLFSSCRSTEIWYGYSSRYAFMISANSSSKHIAIAYLPLAVISDYAAKMEEQGIQSDTLGAVQSLFGLQGNHYIRGSEENWNTLAQALMEEEGLQFNQIRPSVEAMVALVQKHPLVLRNFGLKATLQDLCGPATSAKQIVKLGKLVGLADVDVYDGGRFVSTQAQADELRVWMHEWTKNVLQAQKGERKR